MLMPYAVIQLLSQKQTVALRHLHALLRLLFFTLGFPGRSLVSLLLCEHDIQRYPPTLWHIFLQVIW